MRIPEKPLIVAALVFVVLYPLMLILLSPILLGLWIKDQFPRRS